MVPGVIAAPVIVRVSDDAGLELDFCLIFVYYSWLNEFLEAGKRRLAGDTARAATTDEVKQLRREAQDLKEVVAEQALG
jgi:hypothetical protein